MCLLGLGSMNIPDCPACGGRMRTNGTTSAGRTRWRCKECGSSTSRTYDHRAADLRSGLDWLFFTRTLAQGPVSARTQQRRNLLIWSLMPPVPLVRQRHDVVQVDGIDRILQFNDSKTGLVSILPLFFPEQQAEQHWHAVSNYENVFRSIRTRNVRSGI